MEATPYPAIKVAKKAMDHTPYSLIIPGDEKETSNPVSNTISSFRWGPLTGINVCHEQYFIFDRWR